MSSISFTIPGAPVPKARPRVNKNGHVFTPDRVTAYENRVAWCARAAFEGEPISGPVVVSAVFVLKRPKRLQRRKDPPGRLPHDLKPDLDNLLKSLMDGISRAGLWGDDAQAADFRVSKAYAAKGEEPCVEVSIQAREEEPCS